MLYFAVCVIGLAVAKEGEGKYLLFGMLWSALLMAALRWGIYGALCLAERTLRQQKPALTVLVRTVELLEGILVLFAAVAAVLAAPVLPTAGFLLPVILFGLSGALRFDVRHLL